MDTKKSPSVKVQKDSRGFPAVLASAIHEWLLLFLLFVNAAFSYFVTKFARSSKLQTPCLLCSRLDHVLGDEKPGFYKDLICDAHKLEISSLVYCHIHDKLADVRDMCEGCLFLFSREKKPTLESNRLLVGKLGTNLESYLYQDPVLTHTSSEKQCSCCNETWTSRPYDRKSLQAERTESESSVGHSRVSRDGLKKRNKKRSGQLKLSYLRSRSFEALSHIGYSELKITSESESEIPFSDEDDASTLAQDGDDFKEDFVAQCVQPESGMTTAPILRKDSEDSDGLKKSRQLGDVSTRVQDRDDLNKDFVAQFDKSECVVTTPPIVLKDPEDLAPKKLISQATSPVVSVPVQNEQIAVGGPDNLMPVLSIRAASPVASVVVPNEQIDVREPDYFKPAQATSPELSVVVPNEQIDAGEPDYLTPAQAASPELSVVVPDEQIDVGEPEYLTPVQAASPVSSVVVPNEQIDAGEPEYLTPVEAASPVLSVVVPTQQIDLGEADYLTPAQAASPVLSVVVPDEQIDLGEPEYLTPVQAASPALSVVVPREKIVVGEPDYLTPVEAASPVLSVVVPKRQIEVGEPDYLTPVQAASPVLSVVIPKRQIDVGEPDYLTPVQAASPVLSVVVPKRQIDVGEADYLTPVQAVSPVLSVVIPKEQIDVGEPDYLTPVQAASPDLSVLVPNEQIDLGEPDYLTPLASSGAIGHGLEELNWHQADPPEPHECTTVHDVPSSLKTAETFGQALEETLDTIRTGDFDQAVITDTEKICKLENVSVATTESCLEMDQDVGVSGETLDAAVTGETGRTSSTESAEKEKLENELSTTRGSGFKTNQGLNDCGPPIPILVDQTDSPKLVVGRGSQVSSLLAEQLTPKSSTITNDDLKLLMSQAARGLESYSNDMSPRAYFHGDFDSSSGMSRRITMERNESGVESLDGSIVSEIEGESVVDRLKRQVEYDRKSMSALYKELEEERNASAIAANQAMAMITRLQEEKASLHMEALQYLRMMEEQAEYDVDALQKANDLLAEREKELQDLEAELDMYRLKYPDESKVDEIQDSWCDLNGGVVKVEHSDVSCNNLSNSSVPSMKPEGTNKSEKLDMGVGDKNMILVKDSLSEFEDERLYITKCLKKLEKQLSLFSKNGVYVNTSNGGYSGKGCHGEKDQEQHHYDEATQQNGQLEDNEPSLQKDLSLCRENPSAKENCTSPVGNHQLPSKENHHSDSDAQDNSAARATDLVALENEVSDLHVRLEALEADRSFLEHTINALRNSDEGIQFVQEIAHHLRELRRIGIKRIEQTVT